MRVYNIFGNIGLFIFSCAFFKIERMTNKKEITSIKTLSFLPKKSNNQIILIFNDLQNEMDSISILNFIFIITVYVCIEYLSDIFFQLGLNLYYSIISFF